MYRKLNKDFFKKWTMEMAYVLGFFAADGSMIKNNRGAHFIEFHITDKELLYDIRKVMDSNHKISERFRGVNYKMGYRLQVGSKDMFNDLLKLGFCQNKSLTLKFPIVPKKFLHHFVRGYFDGDGCVYFKKHNVRGRKNKKWVFATRFTCGSYDFLFALKGRLKFMNGGFIVSKSKNSGHELVFSHRDSLALFRFMYNNVSDLIFLNRKYVKFKKAIDTLYG